MVDKVKKVVHEFKAGQLHSGSKQGPVVQSRAQAIAIGLSEQKKENKVKKKRKRPLFSKHPVGGHRM